MSRWISPKNQEKKKEIIKVKVELNKIWSKEFRHDS